VSGQLYIVVTGKNACAHRMGGWVRLSCGLDVLEKKMLVAINGIRTPGRPACRPAHL